VDLGKVVVEAAAANLVLPGNPAVAGLAAPVKAVHRANPTSPCLDNLTRQVNPARLVANTGRRKTRTLATTQTRRQVRATHLRSNLLSTICDVDDIASRASIDDIECVLGSRPSSPTASPVLQKA
jgi:hypothetical protein